MNSPPNPILVSVSRGGVVESIHRGAWVLVEADGSVVEGAGSLTTAHYARSAVKCLQALPLIETGAADRFGFDERSLTLALASHSGEVCHTQHVATTLERIGLTESDLRCGAHAPFDVQTKIELRASGTKPTNLHNNCSGKHAGFLAVAKHLGADLERYLDPGAPGQALAREAITELTDTPLEALSAGIDGCSAPTYRLTLPALATAFARVATPDGLAPARREICRRMTTAVAQFPELVAGNRKRLCTDLSRVSGGALFPKIGAEAVYALGHVNSGRALAVKLDDGQLRGLGPLVVALCERFGWLPADALEQLGDWRAAPILNWSKLEVGQMEVHVEGLDPARDIHGSA